VAAGLLALASLAAAQPVKGTGRQQELAVELAWMADPLTFRCPLTARAVAGRIDVCGWVPDSQTSTRAIELARQSTSWPVVGRLTIRKSAPAKSVAVAEEQLLSEVRQALFKMLGEYARAIDIRIDPGGTVLLWGGIESLERKHRVSVRLRRVAGCSCVVNRLLTPEERAAPGKTLMPRVDGGGSPAAPLPPVRPVPPTTKPAVMPRAALHFGSPPSPYWARAVWGQSGQLAPPVAGTASSPVAL
jgi:hypothetical protein